MNKIYIIFLFFMIFSITSCGLKNNLDNNKSNSGIINNSGTKVEEKVSTGVNLVNNGSGNLSNLEQNNSLSGSLEKKDIIKKDNDKEIKDNDSKNINKINNNNSTETASGEITNEEIEKTVSDLLEDFDRDLDIKKIVGE